MNSKAFFKRHFWLIIAVFAALIYSYPFFLAAFRHSYVTGDDIQTHMQRIEGMLSSYKAGHIPARLHLSTLGNFAYGMGFFYPQLLLVIPLVFRLLGMNFILSTNSFIVLVNILTILSVYFCIYKITGSSLSAFSAAVISLISHYRLADIFYRGSLGETTAFIFTPLLILGLYELFHRRQSGTLWAVVGLSGILYSHLLSFVFTTTLLLLFLVFTLPFWSKDSRIRTQLFIFIFLSLLVTAEFWMPFIEQYINVDLLVKTGYDSPYRPAVSASAMLKIISYWWRTMPSSLYDPLCLTIPVILLTFVTGKRKNSAVITGLTLTGLLGCFLSSNLFPWEKFETLHHFIQFPWRFMFLPASALPLAFGLALGSIEHKKLQIFLSLLLISACVFITVPILGNVIHNYILPSPGYRAIQDGVGAGEYLPAGASVEEIQKQGRNIIFPGDNFSCEYTEKGTKAQLLYQTGEGIMIELPFLYYKGWMYQYGDEKPAPAEHGPHGLVTVKLPPNDAGVLNVFYQKTFIQWAADIFTCIGLAGLILLNKKDRNIRSAA